MTFPVDLVLRLLPRVGGPPAGNTSVASREVAVSAAWQPLVAVRLESADTLACRDAPRGRPTRLQAALEPLGTATNRCAVWVTALAASGVAAPPPVLFRLRQASPPAGDDALVCRYLPGAPDAAGLLAEITGVQCAQWEAWARVDPGAPGAAPVRVALHVYVDRAASGGRAVVLGAQTRVAG